MRHPNEHQISKNKKYQQDDYGKIEIIHLLL